MNSRNHEQWTLPKTNDSDNLERWLKAFLLDRRSQDLSQGTLKFYTWKLKLLSDFAASRDIDRVSQITSTHIREFLIELSHTHNPGGVHAAFRCLRAFLLWYEKECDMDWNNPIRNVKAPRVSILPLEPVDLKTVSKLLKVCDASQFHGARDYAVLLFLLDTGIRASELISLDLDDVDPIGGDVVIRKGKGGKPRIVLIGKRTRKAVRQYLRFRSDDEDAAWVTENGDRLTYWGLNLILKRRSKLANVPKPELHAFRRAFALSCLRSGMDVYSLQKLMGHADLSVLHRYLAQNDDDLRAAHVKASPVDNW